jgi:cysteine desulfuration protein SufE
MIYSADSDAILTKGIISLLLRVYNNKTPEEVLAAEPYFIDRIGLKEHLSPTRANGLLSMVKQIKLLALAHKTKNA